MINPELFTVERLLAALFDDGHGNRDRWRRNAEIVPNYMPPFPGKDTKPACVVRYVYDAGEGEVDDCFLRYSHGPRQGHWWDDYGDDYQTPELALIALLEAPVPPSVLVESVWTAQGGAPRKARQALDAANAIIGEQADEAKRLQDRIDELEAELKRRS